MSGFPSHKWDLDFVDLHEWVRELNVFLPSSMVSRLQISLGHLSDCLDRLEYVDSSSEADSDAAMDAGETSAPVVANFSPVRGPTSPPADFSVNDPPVSHGLASSCPVDDVF